MSFAIKIRGTTDRPIAAEYMCPEHGRFELVVDRDANGDAPAEARCPGPQNGDAWTPASMTGCGYWAPYVISSPLVGVRRVEAVKGGWEKPARPTYLDTRDLGEGQDIEEFRDKRQAIRDQERRDSLKELMNG